MGRFHLRVLGGLQAGGEGEEGVRLPAGKPLALLALIRLDRGGVTRPDAAALLWPESSAERGRASVRQALWTLRRKLDGDVVGEGDDGRLFAASLVLGAAAVAVSAVIAWFHGERGHQKAPAVEYVILAILVAGGLALSGLLYFTP